MRGRLIVVDDSTQSVQHDRDGDNFDETIVISNKDAGRIVVGNDPQSFYDAVRAKVGDWELLPPHHDRQPLPDSSPAKSEQLAAPLGVPNKEATAANLIDEEMPSSNSNGEIASSLIPDEIGRGIILSVGKTVDGFEPRQLSLNISDTRLNQLNIGVAGDLGTGKTQFLKSLILQISRATDANRGIKPRFLIFDYKSDFSSPDFVEATGAKVVKPYHLPLNLFDTTGMGESSAPWLDRFRFFADVLDKVYSGIGPVFVHGCFWHRHFNCNIATIPKSNTEFWMEKFEKNVARDARMTGLLEAAGWKVLVIWECEVGSAKKAKSTGERLAELIRS